MNTTVHTIDLWFCKPSLITDASLLSRYHHLLNAEEAEKVARLKFEKHRKDALITRVFIREILAKYTGMPATSLEFGKGEKGKPYLSNIHRPIFFNLSHTQDLIICGVTPFADIGVDVENLQRNDENIIEIADRYFSPTEVAALQKLPANQKKSRFFDYWTLKESFIKVVGLGLSFPLDKFSFSIGSQPTRLWNPNITLSVDEERLENGDEYTSWIFYPSTVHRIALTIENKQQLEKSAFSLRFFETIPGKWTNEVNLLTDGIV
ncbi:MAG: 4'-phosphopantetheinyl transferase superfamily protein [Cellvibrionales bacterium]|nr:4'-phosphopantetheinyl transferase superfamily protein [Cellvibrionales bacterium]